MKQALEAAQLIDRLDRLARSGELSPGLNPAQWEALRFLSRANRFSRTPAALADYVGSTRGTISQTLISLENKGFVHRQPSARDKRSIELSLTRLGERALKHDPLLALARDIAEAAGPQMAAFLDVLQRTLRTAIARNKGRAFGACRDCKYFQADVHPVGAPHHCALLDESLSAEDSEAICFEQVPAPAIAGAASP